MQIRRIESGKILLRCRQPLICVRIEVLQPYKLKDAILRGKRRISHCTLWPTGNEGF